MAFGDWLAMPAVMSDSCCDLQRGEPRAVAVKSAVDAPPTPAKAQQTGLGEHREVALDRLTLRRDLAHRLADLDDGRADLAGDGRRRRWIGEAGVGAGRPISGPPSDRLTPVRVADETFAAPLTEPSIRLTPSTPAEEIAFWIWARLALKPDSSAARLPPSRPGSPAAAACWRIWVSRPSMVVPAATAASAIEAEVASPAETPGAPPETSMIDEAL